MCEVTQKEKTILWSLKLTNCLLDYPYFKNNVLFKAVFKEALNTFFGFNIDEFSELIKECNRAYKKIDEQLDENSREFKNFLGEILEESNLILKKFDEDEEGKM